MLLLCAACTSASLSEGETRAVVTAARRPEAGYQDFVFGASIRKFAGLDTLSHEGESTVYRKKDDSVAFGVVPVERVLYTFKKGQFYMATITAVGVTDGNKLQACVERLYGPLSRHGLTGYQGRRGDAQVLLLCDYSGNASAFVLHGAEIRK